MDLDDLLLHAWNVRGDVLVEPAVVLLLALPDLGDGEHAIVHEGDVVHEARLRLTPVAVAGMTTSEQMQLLS